MNTHNAPMSLNDLKKREATQNRWENLTDMYRECSDMFGTLLIYPRRFREFNDIATEEEKKHLTRILKNIEADSIQLKRELDEIFKQHCDQNTGEPLKGIIYDELNCNDLFTYTSVAASYRNWMDNFNGITAQPLIDFTEISNTISARTSNRV